MSKNGIIVVKKENAIWFSENDKLTWIPFKNLLSKPLSTILGALRKKGYSKKMLSKYKKELKKIKKKLEGDNKI